ncbi:MAG: sugar phosphate isomerase/epimerase [Akkermansiaceae bacterium]|jgi:sugar phosphate isomerase/epimerase|nr:sugar phosphate isomerase/epimerase [Akkermansiaceae bacterium]
MKADQIAVQLYTLRDHLKNVPEFAETCRKVAAIGYRAVEVAGVDHAVVPPAGIRRICADLGLAICATHQAGDAILNETAAVIDTAGAMGADLVVYPWPGDLDFTSEAAVADLIAKLDAAGAAMAAAGMRLAYHNHQHEFRKLGGRLILERIYQEIPPARLSAEIDTYWVQYGGGDPVAWCRRLAGRLPVIHLKDYRVNDDNSVGFCEVGHGNLDMPAIIDEAGRAGCRWFCVEQDTCPGDPFDSIRLSFEYLAGRCVK